jgi:hypothetical protein
LSSAVVFSVVFQSQFHYISPRTPLRGRDVVTESVESKAARFGALDAVDFIEFVIDWWQCFTSKWLTDGIVNL